MGYRLFLFLLLSLVLVGCTAAAKPDDYVECPVCKQNGDMACLWIKPEKDTPRLDQNGETLYFCSEDCKAEYLKATKDGKEEFKPSSASCGMKSAFTIH